MPCWLPCWYPKHRGIKAKWAIIARLLRHSSIAVLSRMSEQAEPAWRAQTHCDQDLSSSGHELADLGLVSRDQLRGYNLRSRLDLVVACCGFRLQPLHQLLQRHRCWFRFLREGAVVLLHRKFQHLQPLHLVAELGRIQHNTERA